MPRILIIGAGIIGSAIAYELSLINGIEVTLIDKKFPASSSTKGALGVLMGVASYKTKGSKWELCKRSLKRYETLIPELEKLTQKLMPVNYQGVLSLHYVDDYLEKWKDLIKIRNSSGYFLETWEKDTLLKRCPHIKDDKITGAIYSPQDFQINPVEITKALVAGASLNGVNCLFDTKVQVISPSLNYNSSHDLICYHKTSKQTLKADYIVISAGLGSNKLVNKLQTVVKIKPVIGQAMQIDLDTPLVDTNFLPVITGKDVNVIPINPKRYWVGSTVEFPHKTGELLTQSKFLEQIKKQAFAICPDFKNGSITKIWSGKRPRPDGETAPIIQKIPHYSNILLATGHYRNGVLLAPATALTIKDKILEDLSIKSSNY
ncbi:NAD(P)/FAD-dependent oxidoreductase [Candidatus Atelocyanobacterium thalassae]|uniref:Glycine oxidase n=1 Tax=cyanobacterium endosymbiont of Braarudosphaera bigelowii TaxID=1285375 RepID=A0ABM7U3Q9_9CHRO|nr:FAD-dependent oxidoreductase [Candidatus Atelocyanobacterium thalassa]BDA39343.1 glycine oxidase [cyanobacterium endosymbiont of Braarudosphaera bigelowii]